MNTNETISRKRSVITSIGYQICISRPRIAQRPVLNAKHRLGMPCKPPICPSCDGFPPEVAQQQPTPAKPQKRNGALRFSKTIYRGKKPFAWCGEGVGYNKRDYLYGRATTLRKICFGLMGDLFYKTELQIFNEVYC